MLLSALDQSPIFENQSPRQALQKTVELALYCDSINLNRFWVAEHHGSNSFAGCAPEILMATLASQTEQINIGSGGVMLSHYSPYKVAESFKTLTALYPERIDLGIGRAPGGNPWEAGALAWGSATTQVNYYPQKVADLNAWLHGSKPVTEAFRKVKVTPSLGEAPDVFVLVSSPGSMQIALDNGLPIVLAYFIDPHCLHLGKQYKKLWEEKKLPGEPRVILASFALCATESSLAFEQAASVKYWGSKHQHGTKFIPAKQAAELMKKVAPTPDNRVQLIGNPAEIEPKVRELVQASEADELMVITICESAQIKHQSYQYMNEIAKSL